MAESSTTPLAQQAGEKKSKTAKMWRWSCTEGAPPKLETVQHGLNCLFESKLLKMNRYDLPEPGTGGGIGDLIITITDAKSASSIESIMRGNTEKQNKKEVLNPDHAAALGWTQTGTWTAADAQARDGGAYPHRRKARGLPAAVADAPTAAVADAPTAALLRTAAQPAALLPEQVSGQPGGSFDSIPIDDLVDGFGDDMQPGDRARAHDATLKDVIKFLTKEEDEMCVQPAPFPIACRPFRCCGNS